MKPKYVFLAAVLAAALNLLSAAHAASNIRVDVNFDHPEKFTDVKDSYMGTEKGRDNYLALIKEYIQDRAPHYLADGQVLTMTFTDIDLAGDFEPGRGPRWDDVRIIKDIYPPRMKFSYKLTDSSGAVVKEGEEKLIDMSFQITANPINSQDSLHYEKTMIDNWLRAQLWQPKKATSH
jgi:hypothetical protein